MKRARESQVQGHLVTYNESASKKEKKKGAGTFDPVLHSASLPGGAVGLGAMGGRPRT